MLAPVAQLKNGLSGSQGENGACRSEGLERLVAGQHVPDRLGQLASELDLRDLGAALATEAALGALVALLVERVRRTPRSRPPSAPSADICGPCLESGPRRSISPDWLTRGHRPVYPVSLIGEEKRSMSPISAAIVNAGDPADPRGGHQQRDVAMIGARAAQPPLDLTDPPLEIVDQLNARLRRARATARENPARRAACGRRRRTGRPSGPDGRTRSARSEPGS